MRSQARRNLQKIVPLVPLDADTYNFNVFLTWLVNNSPFAMKKGGLPEMIAKIAASVGDEGQAHLEATAAAAETSLLPDASLRALGRRTNPGAPVPGAAAAADASAAAAAAAAADATSITLEDLRNYSFEKLHAGRAPRSIDWALEGRGISQDDTPSARSKYKSYLAALKALIPKTKGKCKGKSQSQDANAAFEKATKALGIKFDASRLSDIAQLVAAIRARMEEQEM